MLARVGMLFIRIQGEAFKVIQANMSCKRSALKKKFQTGFFLSESGSDRTFVFQMGHCILLRYFKFNSNLSSYCVLGLHPRTQTKKAGVVTPD